MIQRFAFLLLFAGKRRSQPVAQPRIWRRLFHIIAGSSIPLAGIFAPEREFLIGLSIVTAGAVSLDLLRFGIGPLNRRYMRWMAPLLKDGENARLTGATHMLLAGTLVFWLFGREVGGGDDVLPVAGRSRGRDRGKQGARPTGIRKVAGGDRCLRRNRGRRGGSAGRLRGHRASLGAVARAQ